MILGSAGMPGISGIGCGILSVTIDCEDILRDSKMYWKLIRMANR